MPVVTRKLGVKSTKAKFPCDQCEHVTQTKYFLNMHKREHTKEKKILEAVKRSAVYVKCEVCESTFENQKRLEGHKRTEHGKGRKDEEVQNDSPERKKPKNGENEETETKEKEEKLQTTLDDDDTPKANMEEQLIESFKNELESYKEANRVLTGQTHVLNKHVQMCNQRITEHENYGTEMRKKYDKLKTENTEKENQIEKLGRALVKATSRIKELNGGIDEEDEINSLLEEEHMEEELNITVVERTATDMEDEHDLTLVGKDNDEDELSFTELQTRLDILKGPPKKNDMEAAKSDEIPAVYRCTPCEIIFKEEDNFRKHMRETHVHDEIEFPCEKCDFVTDSKKLLENHSTTKHRNCELLNEVKCDKCHMKFSTEAKKRVHMAAKHTVPHVNFMKDSQLSCEECNYQTSHSQQLLEHIETKHKVAHVEIVENEVNESNELQNKRKCTLCKYIFISVKKLKEHLVKDHGIQAEEDEVVCHMPCEGNLNYKCKFCDKVFKEQTELATHRINEHKSYKPCKFMNKCRFKDNCPFSHTPIPEGKERCFQCGEEFSEKSHLMKHIKETHREAAKQCHDFPNCSRGENCWYKHEDFPQAWQRHQPPENRIRNRTEPNQDQMMSILQQNMNILMNMMNQNRQ